MTKKKIFLISLAICVIAILSLGTLAWFTDYDEAKNDFTIGQDGDTAEDIFSVDVTEFIDENGNGVLDSGEISSTDGLNYEYPTQTVTPGAKLSKVVDITNTGRYDEYVRVFVTVSDVSIWREVLGTGVIDLSTIFVVDSDFDDKWHRNDAETVYPTATNDTLTYVYYYNGVLRENAETINFMKGVIVPTALEKEHAAAMGAAFDIDFKAEAVQAVNVLDDYTVNPEYQNAIDSFDEIIDLP